ncbi:hypothetical protein ACIP8Z_06000 [Streptomyces sp. NPDC088553]
MLLSGDDLLPVHIAAQVLLHAAVGAHVALVHKHQLINRDHLLARLL